MATYIILNLIYIVFVSVLLRLKLRRPSKLILMTLLALLVMTAVFDSIIVGLDIVDYNPSMILGIYIGYAPIEDFFYALLSVIIVPLLWNTISLKKEPRRATKS